jgi:serine/threonine protein kinase
MIKRTQKEVPTYNNKVDIWCLGILTYEFCCGQPPFESISVEETKRRITKLDFTFPSHLSDLCCSFITECLQLDPESRASLLQLQMHPWLKKRFDK